MSSRHVAASAHLHTAIAPRTVAPVRRGAHLARGWRGAAKRALDLSLALVALVAVLPVLVVAAVSIWAHDRGPVLFRQDRVGRHGRTFRIYKLRTMTCDAEAKRAEIAALNERQGPLFKMADDPRVTRVGRFLRSSSIDELPQLWNVVRGDMSLVGPRPALRHETEQFAVAHLRRHEVRPGITGLWQVEARDDVDFAAFERLDLQYLEHWTLGLDLRLLIRTAGCVGFRVVRAVRHDPSVLA